MSTIAHSEAVSTRARNAAVPGREPALSVILVTPDRFATIRRTMRHLQAQTVADRLEVLIVAPKTWAVEDATPSELEGFYRVRCLASQGAARGLEDAAPPAIRTASAPIVALVEDHVFPAPHWAERLIEAHRGRWAAVGSALYNANPETALSWTNLLLGYGPWIEPERSGPVGALPGHNVSYKRPLLLQYGSRLDALLGREGGLHDDLKARGHAFYLEAGAGAAHLNLSRISSTISIRFQAGWLYGAARARQGGWSPLRRLLYVVGAPLIAPLRLRRCLAQLPAGLRRKLLPWVLPALFLGLALDAAGQALGYAIGAGDTQRRLALLDLHRERHLIRRDRKALSEDRLAPAGPARPLQAPGRGAASVGRE